MDEFQRIEQKNKGALLCASAIPANKEARDRLKEQIDRWIAANSNGNSHEGRHSEAIRSLVAQLRNRLEQINQMPSEDDV